MKKYAWKLGPRAARRRPSGVPTSGVDDTAVEAFAGEDFLDELESVEHTPVTLGVPDELEDHREADIAAAGPVVPRWRRLTPIGLVVRTCFRCSAGKS